MEELSRVRISVGLPGSAADVKDVVYVSRPLTKNGLRYIREARPEMKRLSKWVSPGAHLKTGQQKVRYNFETTAVTRGDRFTRKRSSNEPGVDNEQGALDYDATEDEMGDEERKGTFTGTHSTAQRFRKYPTKIVKSVDIMCNVQMVHNTQKQQQQQQQQPQEKKEDDKVQDKSEQFAEKGASECEQLATPLPRPPAVKMVRVHANKDLKLFVLTAQAFVENKKHPTISRKDVRCSLDPVLRLTCDYEPPGKKTYPVSTIVYVYNFFPYMFIGGAEFEAWLTTWKQNLPRRSPLRVLHSAVERVIARIVTGYKQRMGPFVESVEIINCSSVVGYDFGKKPPKLQIRFSDPSFVNKFRTFYLGGKFELPPIPGVDTGKWRPVLRSQRGLTAYETNVDFAIRFLVDTKMTGFGWITLAGSKFEIVPHPGAETGRHWSSAFRTKTSQHTSSKANTCTW